MKKADTRFDNLVLVVVLFIGLIFIGVSAKAVVKNGKIQENQASVVNIVRVEDVSSPQPILVNGVCGTAHLKEWSIEPQKGFCQEGVLVNKKKIGSRLSWECKGSGEGNTSSCYADQELNPSSDFCGPAAGKYFGTKEEVLEAGLCQEKSIPSSFQVSGINVDGKKIYNKWEWNCRNENNIDSYCYANSAIDGVCGSINGTIVKELPTGQDDYCLNGEYSSGTCTKFDEKNISICRWNCKGLDNGKTAECSLRIQK